MKPREYIGNIYIESGEKSGEKVGIGGESGEKVYKPVRN
jgi:hypothetical protein